MEWVVWGLLLGGFVIGAAYGTRELGVRRGREVERYGGVGTPRPKVREIFIFGLGGMCIGLLTAIASAWIAVGIDALV